jgi:hypothetical protein
VSAGEQSSGETGAARERRVAKNEDFFRKGNEIKERDAALWGSEKCDFICECSSLGCMTRLRLTRSEYEHVRAKGNRFVVYPGHEDETVEVVVETHPAYLVIEKQGEAGDVARATDPR